MPARVHWIFGLAFPLWKVRRGKISKEEHLDSFVRRFRIIVKWVFGPIVAVCVLACVAAAVQALVGG